MTGKLEGGRVIIQPCRLKLFFSVTASCPSLWLGLLASHWLMLAADSGKLDEIGQSAPPSPERLTLEWVILLVCVGITRAVQRDTLQSGGYALPCHHAPCTSSCFLWGSMLNSILSMGMAQTI